MAKLVNCFLEGISNIINYQFSQLLLLNCQAANFLFSPDLSTFSGSLDTPRFSAADADADADVDADAADGFLRDDWSDDGQVGLGPF